MVTVDPPLIAYTNGAVPVKLIVRSVLAPLQIVASPLITDVGRAFTVTVALPVISAPVAVQLASVNDVTV